MIDLGLKEEIVGVSFFCPLDLPKVSSIKINWEKALKLKPTIVFLLDSQVSSEEESFLKKINLEYEKFSFRKLKDIPFAALKISKKLKRIKEGRQAFFKFMKKVYNLPKFENKKIVYILWYDPLIVSSNSSYLGEILEMAGFDVYPKNEKYDFLKMDLEDFFSIKPDLIFANEEIKGYIGKILLKNFKISFLNSNLLKPSLRLPEYLNFRNEIFN